MPDFVPVPVSSPVAPVPVSSPVAPVPVVKPQRLLPLKTEWDAKVKKAKAKLAILAKETNYSGKEYYALHHKYSKIGYLGNLMWRSANGIGQYSMKIENMEPRHYVECRHSDCPGWGCINK
jgi:pyruvate/2-oxoacid:ferredoxin oxidoreductase alpha subunit